jgi:chitodextrinase
VLGAKLRLYVNEGTGNGPAAYKTNWTGSEGSLTWNNRTARTSGAADDKGSLSSGSFVEFNVTSLVTGNGAHSFILDTSSSDGADFASRESSTVSRRPQLIVTFGVDTTDPSPPAGLGAQALSATQVKLAWSAATDNYGVTGYRIYREGAAIATIGTQTAYTDTTAVGGTTYAYEVTALDGAGNESPPSNTATVTTPLTFTAVADARVEEANKSTNFGTSSRLRTEGGSDPDVETFLRFNLTGLSGPPSSAKLRLYATSDGTGNGPAAFSTTWTGSETSLTWNTRTARTSGATDDKGTIASNSFVEFNVTSLVAGSGAHSFILATTSSDGVDFSSRETSTASRRPVLLITP